ncbi:MAG: glycosyltransferase [Desulfovibrio sp.]|nr:glycosyltransferase [Desulfovibrio sp.]
MSAPARKQLSDFAGRPLTLADAASAWELLHPGGEGRDVLLLGLGPGDPQKLPFVRAALERGGTIFWVEEPRTLRLLHPAGMEAPGWRELTPPEAASLSGANTYLYRPGLRVAPDFWGPLAGRIEARNLASAPVPGRPPLVWLPGDESRLLHRELRQALTEAGFSPVCGAAPRDAAGLSAAWGGRVPAFALSVNMRGLDADGRVFHACRALGVPVALWFVDNPWHVLSAARLPWWQEAQLFVTDASFIDGLRAAGAEHIHPLPLAVAPHMWRPLPDAAEAGRLAQLAPRFVGRAAFPDRERFFAAARVPGDLLARALALTDENAEPAREAHFHWWVERLRVRPWPGHEVRGAGLGAERCAQANRARWIAGGLPLGLRVTGDNLWRELVPGCEPESPVDYYGSLPELYREASAVLNVTSLLIPQSLSQRHFDVWAAGGLLLSDATRGLDIFPAELTRPITLTSREGFGPRLAELTANPQGARDLREAWREHLRAAHTYGHRLAFIREKIGV